MPSRDSPFSQGPSGAGGGSIGSTVAHFELLERLGGGGMGVVYKALDLRLDRFVALKFLAFARGAGEEDRRRFLREARAASALDHPNICTVYEIGEASGRLYIAMAFCEGETLRVRIARGPLPVAEALDAAAQIAAGLARAHERGIVHRDVKPGNVIVAPDGQVKIVDFGIAKLAGETRLTRPGSVVGTAEYMSPEQLRGEAIDARTDVWSLGAVLYEMVTGRTPFHAGNETEVVRAILNQELEPASALRPGVPPEVERILGRALAKRPAERYRGMEEMRADLLAAAAAAADPTGWEPTLVDVPSARRPGGTPREAGDPSPGAPTAPTVPVARSGATALVGRTIAHYRVLDLLGGGGMGVVYRAEDTRLHRTVALKFLPPELTRDPEAKARFFQEARAASALDHPNLCTIHEVGETDEGQLYLAMPCYAGETLGKRLTRGPLPLDEATEVARQVAQGLAKAHRQGIVHRDVKPANLMLTEDGVVKILDFGIAKLAGASGLTRAGASLGTPSYMAPEQARGEEVGPAADVWALGVVLYEMAAGRRPFRGEHDQAVLYSIYNEEPPPLSSLRADAPPELDRIVGRMLAKDPAGRYPSAVEALVDLRALRNEPSTGTLQVRSSLERPLLEPARRSRAALWGLLALAAAVAALGGYVLWNLGGSPPPLQTTVSQLTDQAGVESFPSLSPGGDYFLYAKEVGGDSDVFWQRVGGGNPNNLTDDSSHDDTQPALSPDGQQVAFRSGREGGGIFVMGATGESVRRLTDFGYNPGWSPDGNEIVVATEGVTNPAVRTSRSQLWRVVAGTGARKRISEGDAVQPSWSPGGGRIAYWGLPPGGAKRTIWTIPAGGGDPVPVTDDAFLNWNPVWSPDGDYLYFASDRGGSMNLWRVPIDEASGRPRGEPEPVTTPSPWSGFISISRDGSKIAYTTRDSRANLERVALEPERGTVREVLEPVTQGTRAVRSARVSPDGEWIAFDDTTPQEDLFVVRADGSGLRQLTDDPFKDRIPRWSPAGDRILFYSNRGGIYGAWAIRPDGSEREPAVVPRGEPIYEPIWSPDGGRLVCSLGFRGAAVVDLAGPAAERVPRLIPRDDPAAGTFYATAWSPDGGRLAGGFQAPGVVVYSFADRRCRRLTATGSSAFWLADGRRLVYLDGGKVFLADEASGRSRELLAPPPGSRFVSVSAGAGDRNLYLVRATAEGDVALLSVR